jgi:protoporphyrinogen oxidase
MPVEIIEREAAPGGLATSVAWDGFTFDLGPHRFITSDEKILGWVRELLSGGLYEKKRKTTINLRGKYLAYPLTLGSVLRDLGPLFCAAAVADYALTRGARLLRPRADDNFEEWVVSRFGRTLYNVYFGPYTEKVWGIPCTEISSRWAAQRITLPHLGDVIKRLFIPMREKPRTYASLFHYPARCIQEIADALVGGLDGDKVAFHHKSVPSVLHREGDRITGVTFRRDNTEKTVSCDRLLSTIPVTDLVRLIPGTGRDVINAAERLAYRSLSYTLLTLNRSTISDDNWIYFPESSYLFNRISEPRNFSASAAPEGKTSLCCEVTFSEGDDVCGWDDEKTAASCVAGLVRAGLIKSSDVTGSRVFRRRSAYPVYHVGYERDLATVLGYVSSCANVSTFGRQGLFRYNNMDHSIKMGLAVGQEIAAGKERAAFSEVALEQEYFG